MRYMNSILICIFLLSLVPYMGLPQAYDVWVVVPLVGALLYALYRFIHQHELRLPLPHALEENFFEQNREDISPELSLDENQKQESNPNQEEETN